jgi:hypothetical protein
MLVHKEFYKYRILYDVNGCLVNIFYYNNLNFKKHLKTIISMCTRSLRLLLYWFDFIV